MTKFTHRLPHQPWSKPSRNEQEYFSREEFRKRMGTARHRESGREKEERERLLELHRNHCPRCGGTLEPMHAEDVRADQCPNCLGVWMDHEVFDRLTHPDRKNEYLTGIFRDVFLQYTTGAVKPKKPKERKS
jgi:Zn-finger nucleic acid-binding protein